MTISKVNTEVAVVLCTYNGATHIQAQLNSLARQTTPADIFVFDDQSNDNTRELIEAHVLSHTCLHIHSNKTNLGYVANFAKGIEHVLKLGYRYIALSDQDDLWHPEKIEIALTLLHEQEQISGEDTPLLSHSDLSMIDANGDLVHSSFFKYRQYEIDERKNLAIVLGQNGVMGNTVLMNRALARLALPFPEGIHVHDYWLALIAELFGHRLLLKNPMVQYRIHENNVSNSTTSVRFGIEKWLSEKSWLGFVRRDYRLPFKEDSRVAGINKLLETDNGLPALTAQQRELIALFKDYLTLAQSRPKLYLTMLKNGFFRKGGAHRLRLLYSILLTKRYSTSDSTPTE